MTDYISFPSNGNFLAKLDFCFHYYQPKKKTKQNKKKPSWDANLKNNLWLMHYQDWVKNVLSLERKSSGAFNFLGNLKKVE